MHRLRLLIGAGLLGAISVSGAGVPAETPVCPRLNAAPVVDGQLDDAAWREALVLDGFHALGLDRPAEQRTRVRLGFDHKALYVAFECLERNMRGLRHLDRKHDGAVYDDDCVELMLDPEPWEPGTHYHLIANALGQQYDADARGRTWDPDGGWRSAARKLADRWVIEIEIPFQGLGVKPPSRGHVWRMNFMRENYASPENSTWGANPTKNLDNPMSLRFVAFEGRNLVVNGDFESHGSGGDDIPGWRPALRDGADGDIVLESESGNRIARLRKRSREGHVDLGQVLNLQPNTDYRLTARVKYEMDGPAWIFAWPGPPPQVVKKLDGRSKGWETVELRFKSGGKASTAVSGHLGYGRGVGTLFFDDMEVAAVPDYRDPSLLCLTGNSGTGDGNRKVEGSYRYFEPGQDVEFRSRSGDKAENGAPIPFTVGMLTDGAASAVLLTQGKVSISSRLGVQGADVVFDLGKDYFVRQLEVHGSTAQIRNVLAYVRPEGRDTYTLVGCSLGRLVAGPDDDALAYVRLRDLDSAARDVRLRVQTGGRPLSLAEVQIWGEPMNGHEPGAVKALALQAGKEAPVPSAADVPLVKGRGSFVLSPYPRELNRLERGFVLTKATRIVPANPGDARTLRTAEILQEDIKRATGWPLPIAAEPGAGTGQGVIVLGRVPLAGAFARAVQDAGVRVTPTDPGEQGYVMKIAPGQVTIVGSDDAGAFYGTQALMQLIEQIRGEPVPLPGLLVRDWPFLKLRLAYIYITDMRFEGWYQDLLRALTRQRYNGLYARGILKDGRVSECAGGGSPTQAWTQEVGAFCADRFVQLIPTVSVVGEWMYWGPHKHCIEKKPGEERAPRGHGICIDPTLPEAEQLVYKALQDAAEVFPSRIIDIGIDEIYQDGRWCMSERNKNTDPYKAWADFVMRNYTFCKKLGKEVTMLDTMLARECGEKFHPPYNSFWKLRETLPRDIIITTWKGQESRDYLRGKGHRLISWTGYTAFGDSVPHREPLWGQIMAHWGLSYAEEDTFYGNGPTYFGYPNFVYWGEEMWSPDQPDRLAEVEPKRFTPGYAAHLRRAIMNFEALRRGFTFPSLTGDRDFFQVDLNPFVNRALRDDVAGDGKGWLDLGPYYDCRRLPTGRCELGGVPFDLPGKAVMLEGPGIADRTLPGEVTGISVRRRAASLLFLHAVSTVPNLYNMSKEPTKAAFYRVNYADGSSAETRLSWRKNIVEWDHDQSGLSRPGYVPQARPVWLGNTRSGQDITLYAYEWVNPHPEKEIAGIDFLTRDIKTIMKPILFAVTGTVPRE
ncbi:MAG: family 20 glycosylhydrolase [Kiritimatiellae bacterium]|nr:family 20 glycosylhydrolase [Kiritimatiellia bacterium]